MSQRQKLKARLKANVPAVTGRVFVRRAPKDTDNPYIVILQPSNVREYAHDGPAGIETARWQISIFAKQSGATSPEAVAEAVLAEVRATMDIWRDADVGKTIEGNLFDNFEEDTGYYHLAVDYFIGFYE